MKNTNIAEIIGLIKNGTPVLTVNTRLSRYLHTAFDLQMKAQGYLSWQTPVIMPLSSWIDRLWEEGSPDEPLLSSTRAKALWEKVISNDKNLEGLLVGGGVAQSAQDAYAIINEYEISLPESDFYLTEEAKALKKWAKAYDDELKRLGFIDRLSLPKRLTRLAEAGSLNLPQELLLAGFDEITPRVSDFLKTLEAKGVRIEYALSNTEKDLDLKCSGQLTVRPFEDEATEAVQAARWVRSIYKPGLKVGIIVPELNRYRDLIIREFSAELTPSFVMPWVEGKDAFNISLGVALYHEPLVKSALNILAIGERAEDIGKISPVLMSPYFSGKGFLLFASIDARIKEDNCLKASLFDIRGRLREHKEAKVFDAWISELKESRKKEFPSAWAVSFSRFLKKLGWLEGVKLSSREYQALKSWNRLLEELASLDEVLGRISRSEASAKLTSLSLDSIHQRETAECDIQVLGLLEAAGISFDKVWIMGCHEYALPRQPSPNPFIPLYLQKTYDIPHSTHERELKFAKNSLKRIFDSSPEIQVSYPLRSEGKEQQISPLLKGLGSEDATVILGSGRIKDLLRKENRLEEADDVILIPVGQDELKSISGGTTIIKNQSLCPFKAFAEHRLFARAIATPVLGLDNMERGSITHEAMKLFWEEVKDSEKLKELSQSGRMDPYIKDLAERILKEARIAPPLSTRFIEIERERLESLLKDWIATELKRGQGFKVKFIEVKKTIEVEGLTINGRIDRVDTLEDGREIILDYKSGDINKADWLTERPKEPQLLIYSLIGKYDAISFARISPGDCKFVGISRDEGMLPDVKSLEGDKALKKKLEGIEGWDDLMEFWKSTVESLARQFLAGVAVIDPNGDLKGQKSPCVYCELKILCRVAETDMAEAKEDGQDE
ncbi:MAG: PD-(D/E)XK nuclease family protein [Deltaproteobacteria bacterium]|nr:PD-(D/E)XK nuclease family protein [Deltaproteobacteria bacterium]